MVLPNVQQLKGQFEAFTVCGRQVGSGTGRWQPLPGFLKTLKNSGVFTEIENFGPKSEFAQNQVISLPKLRVIFQPKIRQKKKKRKGLHRTKHRQAMLS